MATKTVCDHCNVQKDDAKPTTVAVTVDGLSAEGQSTGLQLAADICEDCRPEATAKMHAAIAERLAIAGHAHKTAIEARATAADRLSELRRIQTQIQARKENTATPQEVAQIEQLQSEAKVLEELAVKTLAESSAKEDQIVAW
jgi:hypothetical protein